MYLQFILNVNINVYFCNFPPGNTNIKFDLSKKKTCFQRLSYLYQTGKILELGFEYLRYSFGIPLFSDLQ